MKRIIIAVVLLLCPSLTGCESMRNRYRWAAMFEMPLICCGGPGNYIQHSASPTYQEAALEYIQIVNLPGGCGSFGRDTRAGEFALAIESELNLWARCPAGCRGLYSTGVSANLKKLKSETIKAGPSVRATHGPPCWGGSRGTGRE